jgi:predicted nucleotidyltransferase
LAGHRGSADRARTSGLTTPVCPVAVGACRRIVDRLSPSAVTVVLYGSEARGDALPDSDIGLLVIVDTLSQSTLAAVRDEAYAAMWDDGFGRMVSVVVVPHARFDLESRLTGSFLASVRAEGATLWPAESSPAGFHRGYVAMGCKSKLGKLARLTTHS